MSASYVFTISSQITLQTFFTTWLKHDEADIQLVPDSPLGNCEGQTQHCSLPPNQKRSPAKKSKQPRSSGAAREEPAAGCQNDRASNYYHSASGNGLILQTFWWTNILDKQHVLICCIQFVNMTFNQSLKQRRLILFGYRWWRPYSRLSVDGLLL